MDPELAKQLQAKKKTKKVRDCLIIDTVTNPVCDVMHGCWIDLMNGWQLLFVVLQVKTCHLAEAWQPITLSYHIERAVCTFFVIMSSSLSNPQKPASNSSGEVAAQKPAATASKKEAVKGVGSDREQASSSPAPAMPAATVATGNGKEGTATLSKADLEKQARNMRKKVRVRML